MIKRVLTLSLALVLLLTAAAFPANAAEKSVFQLLADYIKENGEPTYLVENVIIDYRHSVNYVLCEKADQAGTVELVMCYEFDTIRLDMWQNDNTLGYWLSMTLNPNGKIGEVFLNYPEGRAEYNYDITSITNTTVLKASSYDEGYGCPGQVENMAAAPLKTDAKGFDRHAQVDKMASTMLKADLEILQVVLKQKSKTISDLGFKSYVPGHRHSWDKGTITRQPTCGNYGEKEYSCAACNGICLECVQPTGKHTWDEGKVEEQPTCAHNGVYVYTCTVCGERKGKNIPATGQHTWYRDQITTEPTCTQPGVARYLCSVCWESKEEPVPALGHAWSLTGVISEGETVHDSTGSYLCTRCGETKEGSLCAGEVFVDMPKKSHWAHDAIDWAYSIKLTGGTSLNTFSPNKVVTRGEVVTFLHTLKGKPEAEAENPFTDVKKKDFYYNAVLWAVENGITKGTSETTFSPKNTCSRSEIVMFLWAAAGRPMPENTENKFQDVKAKDYFYNAVLWAVENGVTGGVDETHFGPKTSCTRAQVMLFLKAAAPILTAEETPEEPVAPEEPIEP